MLTVTLSVIAAANIAAAVCMPALKLAGAARAAASYKRLMVKPVGDETTTGLASSEASRNGPGRLSDSVGATTTLSKGTEIAWDASPTVAPVESNKSSIL